MNCNSALSDLNERIVSCTLCPRLVHYREEVARIKRRAYQDCDYWGKPVPSFGDPNGKLLIVGLAPGAHGANRTGRMFTGDRSGQFLYRAMYRAGFATAPESTDRSDGLQLRDAWITAAIHCVPPDNKPWPNELRNCRDYLKREIEVFLNVRVVLLLGKIALDAYVSALRDLGLIERVSPFKFVHNAVYAGSPTMLCSYHPSQQNTSTGRLTESMFDEVFAHAKRLIEDSPILPESPQ